MDVMDVSAQGTCTRVYRASDTVRSSALARASDSETSLTSDWSNRGVQGSFHRMYLSISVGKPAPPPKRQLIVYCHLSKH
jgi:hypothetical protein